VLKGLLDSEPGFFLSIGAALAKPLVEALTVLLEAEAMPGTGSARSSADEASPAARALLQLSRLATLQWQSLGRCYVRGLLALMGSKGVQKELAAPAMLSLSKAEGFVDMVGMQLHLPGAFESFAALPPPRHAKRETLQAIMERAAGGSDPAVKALGIIDLSEVKPQDTEHLRALICESGPRGQWAMRALAAMAGASAQVCAYLWSHPLNAFQALADLPPEVELEAPVALLRSLTKAWGQTQNGSLGLGTQHESKYTEQWFRDRWCHEKCHVEVVRRFLHSEHEGAKVASLQALGRFGLGLGCSGGDEVIDVTTIEDFLRCPSDRVREAVLLLLRSMPHGVQSPLIPAVCDLLVEVATRGETGAIIELRALEELAPLLTSEKAVGLMLDHVRAISVLTQLAEHRATASAATRVLALAVARSSPKQLEVLSWARVAPLLLSALPRNSQHGQDIARAVARLVPWEIPVADLSSVVVAMLDDESPLWQRRAGMAAVQELALRSEGRLWGKAAAAAASLVIKTLQHLAAAIQQRGDCPPFACIGLLVLTCFSTEETELRKELEMLGGAKFAFDQLECHLRTLLESCHAVQNPQRIHLTESSFKGRTPREKQALGEHRNFTCNACGSAGQVGDAVIVGMRAQRLYAFTYRRRVAVCLTCYQRWEAAVESLVVDLEELRGLLSTRRACDDSRRLSPLCAAVRQHSGFKAILRDLSSSPSNMLQSACSSILEEIAQQVKEEQERHGLMCRRCLEGPKLCWTCSGNRRQRCQRCWGYGYISWRPQGRADKGWEWCRRCSGKGSWSCQRCRGSGTVPCKGCEALRRGPAPAPEPPRGLTVKPASSAELSQLRKLVEERGGGIDVVNAWNVDNPWLAWRLRGKKAELEKAGVSRAGRLSIDEIQGFHGTRSENILSICSEGFDDGRRCGQAFGPGEYFAKDPNVSVSYSRGHRYMLVCRLLLGQQASSDQLRDGDHIWAPGPKYYVISSPAQVLPLHILEFEVALRPSCKPDARLAEVLQQPVWSSLASRDAPAKVPENRPCFMTARTTDSLWIGYLRPDLSDAQLLADLQRFLAAHPERASEALSPKRRSDADAAGGLGDETTSAGDESNDEECDDGAASEEAALPLPPPPAVCTTFGCGRKACMRPASDGSTRSSCCLQCPQTSGARHAKWCRSADDTTLGGDSPGSYFICAITAVTSSQSRNSDTISRLSVGSLVEVEELARLPLEKRLRARIKCPAGWISLENTATHFRWAKRQESQEPARCGREGWEEEDRDSEGPDAGEALVGVRVQIVRGKFTQAKVRLARPMSREQVLALNRSDLAEPFEEAGVVRQITVDDAHGSPGQRCPRTIANFCRYRTCASRTLATATTHLCPRCAPPTPSPASLWTAPRAMRSSQSSWPLPPSTTGSQW
jgi:hypothetical protein